MPRTGPNGEYTLPPNTDNQQSNTTIRSAMFNGAMGDVAQAFNTEWPTSLLPQIPDDKGGYRWNWVINGEFIINQRGGPKKPANGVYGYDRWKGHANGIEQPVENLPAGEYTLTWEGGGTGSFGGASGMSPVKATVSAGTRSVVVPETATRVSLVNGNATSISDPFSPRHIQQELALCQRYYETGISGGNDMAAASGAYCGKTFNFKQTKRVVPFVVDAGDIQNNNAHGAIFNSVTTEGAQMFFQSVYPGFFERIQRYAADAEI